MSAMLEWIRRWRSASSPSGPQASPQWRQRGFVLVTVSAVGVIVVLIFSSVIAYVATAEANSVARSLLQVRGYWAMMGHAQYVRARLPRVADGLVANAT
jgi:hypothetical protein